MKELDREGIPIPKTDEAARKYWEEKHRRGVKRHEKGNAKRREYESYRRGSKWVNA